MEQRRSTSNRRARAKLAALAIFPVLLLAPIASRALHAEVSESESGPGTDFIACTDRAWADYNRCLLNASESWEKRLCDIAFEADAAWCGSVYWRRLRTGM